MASISKKQLTTKSAAETQEFASELARKTVDDGVGTVARVFALHGELGGGKTTFAQGFAKALGVNEVVNSPTFVIMKRYEIKGVESRASNNESGFKNFYHIDCYRVEADDIAELGLEDIVADHISIVLIEWAEKVENLLPADTTHISFKVEGRDLRTILLDPEG